MSVRSDGPVLCTFDEAEAGETAICGGKTAGLHRLRRAGLPVPPGFCVTTLGFAQVIGSDAGFRAAVRALDACADAAALRDGARAVREAVMSCALPESFAAEVVAAWQRIAGGAAVAVRSSATAEDLADASFAGQQDSFLSIETEEGLLRALRGCWASLFTERAVTYRRQRGIESGRVSMAVVVQRMVRAEAAGVLFTADPVSGRRGVSVVEAVAGLGEALVSGHATPERYRVRDGAVLERIGSDGAALGAGAGLLGDETLAALCALGRRAEQGAGAPQDIEWAIEDGQIRLLQARPITTLWPLPEGELLPGWRVLLSFGHVQMYTAVLSRVGSSLFQYLIPLCRDEQTGLSALVQVAGERLYIDVTPLLSRRPFRSFLPRFVSMASEPIAARLAAAAQREELSALPAGERASLGAIAGKLLPLAARALWATLGDPREERDRYLSELHGRKAAQQAKMAAASGVAARLEVVIGEAVELLEWVLLRGALPRMLPALVSEKLLGRLVPWLVPGAEAQALLRGLEGNVTTEMDLALSDLADLARDVPALAAALRSGEARARLAALRGDRACARFFAAWDAFLQRHGHRSVGEIDPQVPRWRDDPRVPLRSIEGALDRPAGALREQHAALARRALALRAELIEAARRKPLGALLAPLTGALVDRARVFLGVREEHKFVMVEVIDRVRGVVLEAGKLLAERSALAAVDEVWLLELREIVAAARAVENGEAPSLRALVEARRALRERYAKASPPPVITSEGEVLAAAAEPGAEPGGLVGTAVSGGIYEGIARVVHDPATEQLGAGEVLVTRFTDPGWTPLFGHAGALIMEVGGQMTHGSVIAREMGIPAVVSVEGATAKLRSGDRVRVDGDRGRVTVLEGAAS